MGLRPRVCWICSFESLRVQGCLSLDCCVSSGRDFCVGLITRPEDSYRVCVCVCVCVFMECVFMECDREPSVMKRPSPGYFAVRKWKSFMSIFIQIECKHLSPPLTTLYQLYRDGNCISIKASSTQVQTKLSTPSLHLPQTSLYHLQQTTQSWIPSPFENVCPSFPNCPVTN